MTTPIQRRHIVASLAALATGPWAAAQAPWPNRNITLLHGFGAGGNADVVARLLAQRLQQALGQAVVVDIKSGAGGALASNAAAKAAPDGHTLVLLTGAHTVSAALRRNLPYDPVKDFAFVSTVTTFPFVVAVRADHPARSLEDLLARAKAEPGKLNFSSVGIGSTQHLTGELLASAAGVRLQHIPYRGGGAPVQAVLAGEVDLLVDTPTVALPHIQAGRLRGLGVTSAAPWPTLPGVPTVASRLSGFEVQSWLGLAAPAGTPDPVIARLHAELGKILASPDLRRSLAQSGSLASHSSPEAMRDIVQNDIARWRSVVARAGIAVEG
jgi:tripartite-type tricarboxylate transporter receptor subunit TctC